VHWLDLLSLAVHVTYLLAEKLLRLPSYSLGPQVLGNVRFWRVIFGLGHGIYGAAINLVIAL